MATSSAAERTPRGQGDLLRERLVDAGVALADEGVDPAELSIRSVTKRAGVSPTAFYLHFQNRDELLTAMIARCFTEFRDTVREAVAGLDGPADRLNASGVAYAAFARRWPARYSLIFVFMRPEDGTTPDKPESADDSFNDLLTLVAGYLPEGEADPERLDFLARGIWSGLHGFVGLSRTRTGMGWPDEAEFVPALARAWLGEPRPAPAE